MILNQNEIIKRIPHRPPMLLIDKMIELEEGKNGTGLKQIKGDEPFFLGHFPNNPLMPGAILIECMAQVAAVVLSRKDGIFQPKYLARVDKVQFKKPVCPGDELIIKVDLIKKFGSIAKVNAKILTQNKIVAEGELLLWDEALAKKVS